MSTTPPPLGTALDPVPVDYRVIALYSRDAGRRSARLFVDIGAGTGDIGDRGYATVAFNVLPARSVALSIRDGDGAPVTCSLLIRDAQGRVYPAQTKRVLPDLYFQKKVYRADGQTLTLPPGEYSVETARGPEYLIQRGTRAVHADAPTAWQVRLERWIDPRRHGYYSGDHHIHASGCAHYQVPEEGVSPSVMAPQVQGEAINIGAVLTWGPGFYTQKLNFSGRDDAVSRPQHLLHYDLEVSGFPSSHCGHLVLLGMKAMDYPGTTKIEQWPSSNTPVLEWAREQGAITGYAHSGSGLWAETTDLPNYKMPAFDGIGANDYIVTVTAGLIDFMSTVNTTPAAELNIWYHTLNTGFRARISGETDWPCFYDENIGMGRSYVKLDAPLTYTGWCTGLKQGRNYVSEGRAHLMNFRASSGRQRTEMGGADIALAAPAPVRIEALVAARIEPEPTAATDALRSLGPLDKPYWHLERARLGTSTPKADPGGDYAQELFDKADSVRPGATALLKAKARAVVGGRIEPGPTRSVLQAEAMIERGTDVSVGYCSSRQTRPDASVHKVELPPELAVRADYGIAIVTTSHDARREAAAGQLALYLLAPEAQSLLADYGFAPR